MKKLLYTFLAASIIFAACKKEDEVVAPAVINGCMDGTATNYNSNATTDDGSCTYSGCMDPIATNYNANATVDDGSCIYGIVGVWTPTSVDIDSSMTTTIAGDIIDVFDFGDGPEILSYSGSQTMTPEEADIEGDIEFTADGKFITDDTASYTYSNNVLTIIEYDDEFSIESNDSREKFQLEQIYMKNIKICKNKCNCSFRR